MPVTLFLTRTPLKEFLFRGTKSGRFGELIAVNCPKVQSARILAGASMPIPSLDHAAPAQSLTSAAFPAVTRSTPMPAITRSTPMPAMTRTTQMQAIARPPFSTGLTGAFGAVFTPNTQGKQFVKVEHGVLEITFVPPPGNILVQAPVLTGVKRFTTMERFKADTGKGFYVQLHPSPKPYWISYEASNSVVKGLREGHDGRCFRVHGGRSTPEKGILIHEAPHVGWVIGCIGPRPLGNRTLEFENRRGNESYKAMNELFEFVGHERADFFVLDW